MTGTRSRDTTRGAGKWFQISQMHNLRQKGPLTGGAKILSSRIMHAELSDPGRNRIRRMALAVLLSASLGLAGCSGKDGAGPKGPPEVGYRVVHATSAPIELELPGRIAAAQTAEVRPQIAGIIQRRLFTEGALVHAGQPLYRIDSRLYRAAAEQAQANLASAEASAAAQQTKADRYKPLADQGAVAAQDYTDAAAAARQARAAVAQTRAALNAAQVNLRFTTVPAPITGRIGRSLFTEGALVTTGQAGPMAVISVLDPVYVDLQQSAVDLLRLRQQLAGGGQMPAAARVWLYLDGDTRYPIPGELAFSEVTADPATGTVTLRARFPNPQGLLLPGMFVHARLEQGEEKGVFLVPQEALQRDLRGMPQVLVVGAGGKAEPRDVTTTRTLGRNWVVTAGLREGDRLITQGLGKARPDQPVKAVPESAPQLGAGGHHARPAH